MERETDELLRLERKPEVFLPADGAMEAPAAEFVPGPYYMSADERIPEVADENSRPDHGMAAVGGVTPSEGTTASQTVVDRRDILRFFSAGALMSATACVRRPAEKIVPHVRQPRDHIPGVPVVYATTCGECAAGCGVLVKTREGRPVKLEGSPEHPISQGGLCGMGQAAVQGLYHPERLKGPHVRHGRRHDPMNWDDVFQQLASALKDKKKIGIFTGGSTGHRHQFFREVLERLGSDASRLYTYEANGLFASVARAHEIAFGQSDLPRCDLKKAQVIVGIGSDFHDVGTSVVYHTKGFAQSQPFRGGSRGTFVQFESHLSLTGSRADIRHVIAPGSETHTALILLRSLYEHRASRGSAAARTQVRRFLESYDKVIAGAYQESGVSRELMDKTAEELLNAPSLVVAGGSASADENSTLLQLVTIMANVLTGAYGSTLMMENGWQPSPVKVGDLGRFLQEAPELDALFVIDSNPVFTVPESWGIRSLLEKIPLLVSVQPFPNEVDQIADISLPAHHYLESWGDEQPVAGFWSARQPAVRPTTDSRQAEDSFLWLLAYMDLSLPYKDYRSWLMDKWRRIYHLVGTRSDFETFFKAVLRRGFVGKPGSRTVGELRDLRSYFRELRPVPRGLILTAPLDSRFQDGRSAHLPVLQEMGDRLTTIAWDSWLALSPETMRKMGLRQNQLVKVRGGEQSFDVAVFPLPGLHAASAVIPRGNGHLNQMSTISYQNGVNPLVAFAKKEDPLSGQPVTASLSVELMATGDWYRLAAMQKQNDIANRSDIVKKVSLTQARKNQHKQVDLDTVPDLYPALEKKEYRWGMSIDLSKCNGCGACMVACSLENNVPQVGREQILLGREMHWIRLDRYFYGPVDQPVVTFQPVMCQHCMHAPCEAVCPVFATTHDPEGLNAMTYNRCVGTRYCANACPYKVRRFNWWTHKWGVIGSKATDRNPRALNPDVTVRTRGVMEKCSFCVGRLRDAKHEAKKEKRTVRDGEVKTACQQTCPADAISFGNLNDPDSQVSRERRDSRAYLMLGGDPEHGHYGLKTLPGVSYLAQVTLEEHPATGFGQRAGNHGHPAAEESHGAHDGD